MLFAVRFTDRPNTLPIRQQFLPAHLAWLDQHQATVLVAGSVRAEPDGPALGGLWVVEAESKAAVAALIDTDPFWIEGLREGYEILHWAKAHPQRQALV